MIEIVIPGKPVPKGRPRFCKKSGIAFTPKPTRAWEKMAGKYARVAMGNREPLAGPVQITVIAMLVPADSWPSWKRQAALEGLIVPTAKPDLDNLVKSAKDALNEIVWLDDGQVVNSAEQKRYNESPGVVVTIEPLPFCASQISTRKEFDEFLINQRSDTNEQ